MFPPHPWSTSTRSLRPTCGFLAAGAWCLRHSALTAIFITACAFFLSWIPQAEAAGSLYQGFGATTPGGAGQPTYYVTNLNDSGPGSLRDALSQGNRSIVFLVGGKIVLNSQLFVQGAFLTMDGFTAPPPGITLTNRGLIIRGNQGAHDVIVRGIRVREANATDSTDCIQVSWEAYNIVIDHVSTHGCGDGNIDITDGAHDVTVSWSILAQPESHKPMLIDNHATRITLHHNLFVKGTTRNPLASVDPQGTPATDTTLDMRNNLVWDWGGGYGTLARYGANVNIVNNFYANPRGSGKDQKQTVIVCKGDGRETRESLALCEEGAGNSAALGYVQGNFSADGVNVNVAGTESSPFSAPVVDTQEACAAALAVLTEAGAPLLDALDSRYLTKVSLAACGG